jgi:hypothetical protein
MKAMKLAAALTAARAAAKKNAPQVNAAIDKAATAAKAKVGPQHHATIDSGTRMAGDPAQPRVPRCTTLPGAQSSRCSARRVVGRKVTLMRGPP